MKRIERILYGGPKDERNAAQLGPIYKVGFYILAFGILFDVFTRYNYLARENAPVNSPVEFIALLLALAFVSVACMRRGIYTDSLQWLEAETFSQTGAIAPSVALAALISLAAVGGRVYYEIALSGLAGVTWAGDIAFLIVMLGMTIPLIIAIQYLSWRDYRKKEAKMASEEED
jgi:hypothetical protein